MCNCTLYRFPNLTGSLLATVLHPFHRFSSWAVKSGFASLPWWSHLHFWISVHICSLYEENSITSRGTNAEKPRIIELFDKLVAKFPLPGNILGLWKAASCYCTELCYCNLPWDKFINANDPLSQRCSLDTCCKIGCKISHHHNEKLKRGEEEEKTMFGSIARWVYVPEPLLCLGI